MGDLGNLSFGIGLDRTVFEAEYKKFREKVTRDLNDLSKAGTKLDVSSGIDASYKKLLNMQQKIEAQVRKTVSIQQGAYVESINMATMATSEQYKVWKRISDEMTRLERKASKEGKYITLGNTDVLAATMVVNKSKERLDIERKIGIADTEVEASKKRILALEEHINNTSRKTVLSQTESLSALSKQSRVLNDLKAMALSYASIYGASRLLKSLYEITGEFELQKVALTAIIKDAEKAEEIYARIQKLAVMSPFQFKDLISFTKQLSAYSIPVNELYDTTKMLADVSAGLGVGMDRLVLAYGQIRSAAVLRGQEIRQLTESGIPVLEELRKKFVALGETGITTADVFDKVSSRLVPFSMIKDIFTDMTSEGGKFYKMQEIQAETLRGKISNLRDAFQIALYEIGSSNSDILKGSVDLLRSLIDNLDKVGLALKSLIVVYGTYRTAIMVANIAGLVAQYGSLVKAIKMTTVVQKILNSTIMENPYVFAFTMIATLTMAIVNLRKESQRLNNELKDLTGVEFTNANKAVGELDKLKEKLEGATVGSKDYMDAMNKINEEYGPYLSKLLQEKDALSQLKVEYDTVTAAIYDKARAQASEKGVQKLYEEFDASKQYNKVLSNMVSLSPGDKEAAKKRIESFLALYQAEVSKQKGKFNELELFNKLYKEQFNVSSDYFKKTKGGLFGFNDFQALDVISYVEKLTSLNNALAQFNSYLNSQRGKSVLISEEETTRIEEINNRYAEQEAYINKYVKLSERAAAMEMVRVAKLNEYKSVYESLGLEEKVKAVNEQLLNTEKAAEGWRNIARSIASAGDEALLVFNPAESQTRAEYVANLEDEYKKAQDIIDKWGTSTEKSAMDDVAIAKRRVEAIKSISAALGYLLDVEKKDKKDDEATKKKIKNLEDRADSIKIVKEGYEKLIEKVSDEEAKKILSDIYPDADLTKDFTQQLEEVAVALDKIGSDDAKEAAQNIRNIFGKDAVQGAIDLINAAAEYDKYMEKWGRENFGLFGTGSTYDISKVITDYENNLDELNAKRLKAVELLNAKEKDKASDTYKYELALIDKRTEEEQRSIRVTAQERVTSIARAVFDEQTKLFGLDLLLNDIGDKSIRQINEAMKRIAEMSDVDILEIPQSAIDALALYGYEIDNIAESELDGIFEKTGELIGEEEQRLIRLIVVMKTLGISTQELNDAYKKLVEQQKKDTEEEKQKKIRAAVIGTAKEVVRLAEAVGKIFESFGNDKISDMASAVGSVADIIQSAASGAKTGSWIGAIVGAATSLIGAISADITKINELKNAVKDAQLTKWISDVNEMLSSGDTIFGKSFFGGVSGAIDAASASMDKYNKTLAKAVELADATSTSTIYKTVPIVMTTFGKIPEFFAYLNEKIFGKNIDLNAQKDAYVEAFKNAYEAGYNEIESFVIRTNNRVVGNFFGWQDEYAALKDVVEELGYSLYDENGILNKEALQAVLDTRGEQLEDAQKIWLNEAIAGIDEYEKALKALDSYISELFGNLASDIATSMLDSFKEMGDAAYGIADVFDDVSESIIKNLLQTLIIEEILDKYKTELREIFSNANLTDDERAKAMLKITGRMEQDILLFAKSKQAFLEAAKQAGLIKIESGDKVDLDEVYQTGYDKYATDEMKYSDTLKEYIDDMELYNKLADEATSSEQQDKWRNLARLAKSAFDGAVLEDFNTKLEESLSGIDDNYEKMSFLQKMLSSLSDQAQIDEVTKQLKELKETVFADLYSTYSDDTQQYVDKLAEIQKHLKWAIENGYPELAKWIQKAYDTAVLDEWISKVEEASKNLDSDYEKYIYYGRLLAQEENAWLEATMAGENTSEIDNHIAYLQGILGDLRNSIKDNIWSGYATDAQKYEKELAKINEDLSWAIRNYGELSDEIAAAFNAKILENWKDGFDGILEDTETAIEKLNLINSETEKLGGDINGRGWDESWYKERLKERDYITSRMGEIEEGSPEWLALSQRLPNLLELISTYERLIVLEQEESDLRAEMYEKYETDEEAHKRRMDELTADMEYFASIGDDVKVAQIADLMNEELSNFNTSILSDQFDKSFSDIEDASIRTVLKMIEDWKKLVDATDELTDEEKENLKAKADEILNDLASRTEEAYNNVKDIISELSNLLGELGADSKLTESLNLIGQAVGQIGGVVSSIVTGNWVGAIIGAIQLIVTVVKFFKNIFGRDVEQIVKDIAKSVENAEKAVNRAIGPDRMGKGVKLLEEYAIALAKVNKEYDREKRKIDIFENKDLLEQLIEERERYEDAIYETRESLKKDLFQTDMESLSRSLVDVVANYKDNLTEMARQLNLTIDDMIKNMIANYVSVSILEPQINSWMESIFGNYLETFQQTGNLELPVEKLNDFREWLVEFAPALAEMMSGLYEGLGLDEMNYQGTVDSIKGITESTANSLVGYMQNIMQGVYNGNNIKQVMAEYLRDSNNSDSSFLITFALVARNVQRIADNTDNLSAIRADIKEIRLGLSINRASL